MNNKLLPMLIASILAANASAHSEVSVKIEKPVQDALSEDIGTNEKGVGTSLYVSPHISSTPTAEVGGGATLGYVYNYDNESGDVESSEKPFYNLAVSGTYFSSKSYALGAINQIVLDGGNQKIETRVAYEHYYNKYDSDSSSGDKTVSTVGSIEHRHSLRMIDDWFIGGHVKFTDSKYRHENRGGKEFLADMNYSNTQSFGLGVHLEKDTRDNTAYPTSGNRIGISTYSHFDELWNTHNYHYVKMNFTDYRQVRGKDVIATNIYGRYSTDTTPTAMQSSLGDINIIRGFKHGQIVGAGVAAIQSEYRYFINDDWKAVGFVGAANVVDGASSELHTDGKYYSVGIGARYKLMEGNDTNLRIDLALGSEENHGIYIGFQEAF